ncbi:WD40 repeat-like protein [Hysterangium stoloniferum]|nr:WD40 repeat-like protein [Hysterangium stoloniferum]
MHNDSLIVPLVLNSSDNGLDLERAYASCSPTKTTTWGLAVEQGTRNFDDISAGAAVGCEDGSVFVFYMKEKEKEQLSSNLSSRNAIPTMLQISSTSAHPSRTPSPTLSIGSSHKTSGSRNGLHFKHAPHPLSHRTRSRVTSSVSKASAEAPRNSVDFDEEKDKLEELVKNAPPKGKSLMEGLMTSYAVAGMGFHIESDRSSVKQQKRSRTAPSSASPSPRNSLSAPPSPSISPSPSPSSHHFNVPSSPGPGSQDVGMPSLKIKFHVFPQCFKSDSRIVSLICLSSGILLALNLSGVVTVISTQSGLCIALLDLDSLPMLHPPPTSSPSAPVFGAIADNLSAWTWKTLQVIGTQQGTIILASASDQSSISGNGKSDVRTRIAILQLESLSPYSSPLDFAYTTRNSVLQKVSEWVMDGDPKAIGLLKDSASSVTFYYTSSTVPSSLIAHTLEIVPPAFVATAPDSLRPSPEAISSSSVVSAVAATPPHRLIPIPNPFKPKDGSHSPQKELDKAMSPGPGRVVLGAPVILGVVPDIEAPDELVKGLQIWDIDGPYARGALWSSTEFLIFESTPDESNMRVVGKVLYQNLDAVIKVDNESVILADTSRANSFRLPPPHESIDGKRLTQLAFTTFETGSIITAPSSSLLLCCMAGCNLPALDQNSLVYAPLLPMFSKTNLRSATRETKEGSNRTAWASPPQREGLRITSLLPIELDSIILGFSDNSLCRSSLTNLLILGWHNLPRIKATGNAAICSLHLIKQVDGAKFIVGGTDDGGVSIWDLSSFQLRARWILFTESLVTVIPLMDSGVGRLQGYMLCISGDGTLAVINMDGFEFLYLIPGAATHLCRICLGEDNLLLMYADNRARLWDVKTREFWRSMSTKTANELVVQGEQGEWSQFDVTKNETSFMESSLAALLNSSSSLDAASTLLVDVCALSNIIHPLPPSQVFRDPRFPEDSNVVSEPGNSPEASIPVPIKKSPRRLRLLKALVAALHTFGLDSGIDEICKGKLAVTESKAFVGTSGVGTIPSLIKLSSPREFWQISPEHTACRQLALVTVLRGFLAFDEDCEQFANEIITFYVTSLPDIVGSLWQPPSLSLLARYWFHSSVDLRLAARALFGTAAARLSDENTIHLVEYWQHELPCLQPDTEKQSASAALALLITGNIAIERYAVLSTSTLTDIAKSITLYLHDESCPHRNLAIDLCSRGFQIWQHHVDAMEVLRALFNLSTSADKERNVGPQARLAVLQIASSNTPLFMTTLSLDILHPRSVQQRKSILQLVAFLIRKKPLVLYPNLPRLVEAVVKSLDPSSSNDRDAIMDAATEILGQVVKFFPSVDFHMATQRLCVGTSEGAVIMYDLKTATRLYVLEGHKKRLDACSFSPDGRRLVTVSLEESVVRVWKVGSSLTSLFLPGAPPRQGNSGSQPFKTIPFNAGDEGHMTTAAVLEWVQFEWPSDRTARLKIRDIAFTFNT